VLSEIRSLTFRPLRGSARHEDASRPGRDAIDPLWDLLVHWHAVENPRLARAQNRAVLEKRVHEHAEGARIWSELMALDGGGPR
jgi:hypothetical protein